MKEFNSTGVCIPEMHYMADLSSKMEKIMNLIERGKYFTINRPRQYGKTTALFALCRILPKEYTCINISFEGIDNTGFESPQKFCQMFLRQVSKSIKHTDEKFALLWLDENVATFEMLSDKINELTLNRKVVLAIDEVDKASNYEVFLYFLGAIRNLYLTRMNAPTFQSVILASVHDVKNLKVKMAMDDMPIEDSSKWVGSPWNIAADFEVDMSFNPNEIASMLIDYEDDRNIKMDTDLIASEIYRFTSGYPYLVSRICLLIDTHLNQNWTIDGVRDAIKIMTTTEKNTLYNDLFKNLRRHKEIYEYMYDLLMLKRNTPYSLYSTKVEWSILLGFVKMCATGEITIANKIFETILLKYFITEESMAKKCIKQS